jgi:sialate O-acetylesterase
MSIDINRMRVLLGLSTLLLAVRSLAGGVEVASIFGPEMILQRDASVPVWGRAPAGEKVTVTFAAQSKTALADGNGRWSVKLDKMSASARGRAMVVKGSGEPVTFENVRVGEVWLVMTHGAGKQYSTEGPIPRANTRIRAFDGRRDNHSPTPRELFGRNATWGPGQRNARFDVMSIPFANRLSDKLGAPVGIVRVRVGDLEATIPFQGFAAVGPLEDIAERVDTWYPKTKRGGEAYQRWFARMKEWKQTLGRKFRRGEHIVPIQPPLIPGPTPGDSTQPTVVFNHQLNPLTPFAFRGALHVHNESNTGDPRCTRDPRYAHKMRALIAGLRAAFGCSDLAFAFTQRNQPNIYHTHTAGGKVRTNALDFDAWYGHRDRQRRVLPYENTGMVVTLDVENYSGRIGERFARWALAKVYDKGGAVSGPIYKSHRIQGDRVVIEFHHGDGGLMAAGFPEIGRPLVEQKGAPLRFFALAGADRIFHRAEARIKGNTVVARSDAVAKPEAVRYACHFDPRGMNLYNRAGLPASPFRTDDWPIADLDGTVDKLTDKSPEALGSMLGYPTMLHSHAAARALAKKGAGEILPAVKRLLASKDPDQRCGALRTLGYLYWLGLIPRGSAYYSLKPQKVTPAIARAIEMIAQGARDADPLVRRSAAEALSLIGSENENVFAIIRKLALDDDALVRTAAMRMSKYRFNTHAHNTALAYALLDRKGLADRTAVALAGNLLNHYRIEGPIDVAAAGRYFKKIGPGQGGSVVGGLGDMLRRVQATDGQKALGHPEVMPGVLHLYSLGYRNYFLYGIWRWVKLEDHLPALRQEIKRLEGEIKRLKSEKPDQWADLSARYADAIEGLQAVIDKARTSRKK